MPNSTTHIDWKSIPASLSPEQKKYNDLRGNFAHLATYAAEAFSTDYSKQFDSLESIVQGASALAVPHIQGAIDHAIKQLAAFNIFDIDREHFTTTYYKKYDSWSSVHERIAEKLAEIVCSAAEMDAYRTARRQGSGQVMGGGFGLEGAARGIAVAGAANLAIGAAHGLFNLLAKGLNSVADSGKKNNIFRDPKTKADLVSGLEKAVLDVHLALLDALDASTTTESAFQRVSVSDQDKAQRMLTNLQGGLLSNAHPGNVLRQVLASDPYCMNAYLYALNMGWNIDGNIDQTAKFFHLNLPREKRKLVLAAYKDSTEADVKNSIREIEELGARLGLPVEGEFLIPLKVLLTQFDVNARTFKGHLYPTRDGAKRAREIRAKESVDFVKNGAVRVVKAFLYFVIISMGAIVLLPILFPHPAPAPDPAKEGLSNPYTSGSMDPALWRARRASETASIAPAPADPASAPALAPADPASAADLR